MAVKKALSSHPSTNRSPVEKKDVVVLDEYFDLKARQGKPVTMHFIDVVTDKLLEWVALDTSLKMQQFYSLLGMCDSDFTRIMGRSERLEKAYRFALKELGARREIGALTRKYDANFAYRNLYKYDSEWKEVMEFHHSLAKKNDESTKSTETIVAIPVHTSEPDWREQFARAKSKMEKERDEKL